MPTQKRYSPEFRERTVRLLEEHRSEYPSTWAAVKSIAAKAGMSPETLRSWIVQAERDAGKRPGLTTDERRQLKDLEKEVFELRRANEILKAASVFFARELDPRLEK